MPEIISLLLNSLMPARTAELGTFKVKTALTLSLMPNTKSVQFQATLKCSEAKLGLQSETAKPNFKGQLPTLETVKAFVTEAPGAIVPQLTLLEETLRFSVEATLPEPAKTIAPEKRLEALYDKQTSKPQISNAASIGEYSLLDIFISNSKEKREILIVKKRKR